MKSQTLLIFIIFYLTQTSLGQTEKSLLYNQNGGLRIDSTYKISPMQFEKWKGVENILINHLNNKLEYAEMASDYNLSGLSLVSFDIDSSGKIIDFTTIKQVGGGLEERIKDALLSFNYLTSLAPDRDSTFTYYLSFEFRLIDVNEFITSEKAIPVFKTKFDFKQE